MKNLKNKILVEALALASLGFFGEKNLMTQNTDSLDNIIIKYDDKPLKNPNSLKTILAKGYKYGVKEDKLIILVGCYDNDGDRNYDRRLIIKVNQTTTEWVNLHFDTGLIDYGFWSNTINIDLRNLTKEQIYQDEEFAERTKRIINACESDEKLKELVKEIYKEGAKIKIPQIKQ